MKLAFGILVVCGLALAQVRVIGTIERVGNSAIQVTSAAQSVTVQAGAATEVWKSGARRSLSALRPGDEISAECRRDASGRLIADVVRAGTIDLSGTVTSVSPASFEIAAADQAKPRVVRFYPATVFSTSARDLASGRKVHVVALDAGGGAFDAARVTLYNTDVPVE